jgi:hypothetical protein
MLNNATSEKNIILLRGIKRMHVKTNRVQCNLLLLPLDIILTSQLTFKIVVRIEIYFYHFQSAFFFK